MSDNSLTPPPGEENQEPDFLHSEAVVRDIPLVPLLAVVIILGIFLIYAFVL